MAYQVFPDYQRQRIALETVKYLVSFLCVELDCKTITACVETRNYKSYQLLESLHFNRVDYVKDADFFDGHTSVYYEIKVNEVIK